MKASSFDPPKGAIHHRPIWFDSVVVTFFSMSLAVNAGVTSLIVFKILIVYHEHQQELKTGTVYPNGRVPCNFYPTIISILVESGLITFIGQLVQVILYKIDANASPVVYGVIVMLHVSASCWYCILKKIIFIYTAGNFINYRPWACCHGPFLHYSNITDNNFQSLTRIEWQPVSRSRTYTQRSPRTISNA